MNKNEKKRINIVVGQEEQEIKKRINKKRDKVISNEIIERQKKRAKHIKMYLRNDQLNISRI